MPNARVDGVVGVHELEFSSRSPNIAAWSPESHAAYMRRTRLHVLALRVQTASWRGSAKIGEWTSPCSSSAPPDRCRPCSAHPRARWCGVAADRILIDCGEGTQRQLLRSVGLPDIEHIFLTHYHADHFLGLPGM